jgi:hypothetical protein
LPTLQQQGSVTLNVAVTAVQALQPRAYWLFNKEMSHD